MTVAAPPRTPEKLASRPSPCPLCPELIEKGDPIRPTTVALGWAHSGCATDYFEVYPEHFDDKNNGADDGAEES